MVTPASCYGGSQGGRSPQAGRQHHHAASLVPRHDEVLIAIDSLYADQLKPFGRILRKRVAELASPGFQLGDSDANLPDVDIKHLRNVCASSDQLQVVPEEGGDWSALIRGREPRFVNVYSPCDMYTPELWEQSSRYFQSLSGDEMCLPGGRYSCAQALVARRLHFLANRSLGEVCHIVQLAISQKRILGYYCGAVVPYSRSQSMVKEWCAYKGAPCTSQSQGVATGSVAGAVADTLPLATWDEARDNLRMILDSAATPGVPGVTPLSNVKRLFRSRFQVELSETMLGYSKLSELLQDPRLKDICTVQLQGHGYIVVQNPSDCAAASALNLASNSKTLSLADSLGASGAAAAREGLRPRPPPVHAAREALVPRSLPGRRGAMAPGHHDEMPPSDAPCRVEIGCDSPLQRFRAASPVHTADCFSPSISPARRNRILWPDTPDRSPTPGDRFNSYANFSPVLGPGYTFESAPSRDAPPSLRDVHVLVAAPAPSLGGCMGTQQVMYQHQSGQDGEDDAAESGGSRRMRLPLLSLPLPERAPSLRSVHGLAPAPPTAPAPPAPPAPAALVASRDVAYRDDGQGVVPPAPIGRDTEVRISSPKRSTAIRSSIERTVESPGRHLTSPSLDDEPMKIPFKVPTNDGCDSPLRGNSPSRDHVLGGGSVSGSISPTLARGLSQVWRTHHHNELMMQQASIFGEDEGLVEEAVNAGLMGLPGQPYSPHIVAAKSAAPPRWAAHSPSRLNRDVNVGKMAEHDEVFPGMRSISVPKAFSSNKDAFEAACHTLGYLPRPADPEANEDQADAAAGFICAPQMGDGAWPATEASHPGVLHLADLI